MWTKLSVLNNCNFTFSWFNYLIINRVLSDSSNPFHANESTCSIQKEVKSNFFKTIIRKRAKRVDVSD